MSFCSSFNPTLVRLRLGRRFTRRRSGSSFNPTLVRLRRHSPGGNLTRQLFQSHAGSIEAGKKIPRGCIELLFQSHAGSIEARLSSFISPSFPSFQSHAGSIEAPDGLGRVQHNREFQSHAGSIEACPGGGLGSKPKPGFNPTLVRLRQEEVGDVRI